MAKFTFSNFNKERLFDIDTSDFEYKKLEDLYNENGENAVYPICGLYLGTKSQFAEETPIVATDECYVNIPDHQLAEVKAMLASKEAIAAVNAGKAGFIIEKYYQKRFKRDCFAARWVDYDEALANAAD